jgi:periplasmic protein TonB
VKLRTTASLSLAVLTMGVVGTAWLSSLTDRWPGPDKARPSQVVHARPPVVRHARPAHEPRRSMLVAKPHAVAPKPVRPAPLPSLTPVDMPAASAAWFGAPETIGGRVVLLLTVDGKGRVKSVSITQSSGHAVLDGRAVRTVLGWRFAVPAGHPAGLKGSLAMRFTDESGTVARLP